MERTPEIFFLCSLSTILHSPSFFVSLVDFVFFVLKKRLEGRGTMDELEIIPPTKPIRTTVRVPGSKSITNRALPLAALCEGEVELTGVLFADDTWQMINALQSLGYSLQMDQKAR